MFATGAFPARSGWGHRIPAWMLLLWRDDRRLSGTVLLPDLRATGAFPGSDILDTWFNSALWPFSTLGWPDQTSDLKRYFPTSVLVTGYDIIYFWVDDLYVSGIFREVPFKTVYINGLVRSIGRKMSKSLGNGVDPWKLSGITVQTLYGLR